MFVRDSAYDMSGGQGIRHGFIYRKQSTPTAAGLFFFGMWLVLLS